MSSSLGSTASLSRSAGGLAVGMQERNRWWIRFLEARRITLEGKLRSSGDLERARELGAGATLSAPFVTESVTEPVATTAGVGWGSNGATIGTNQPAVEDE